MRWTKKALRFIREHIGLREALTFGGIGCTFYGLHLVYPPAAWCAAGVAFFWLGR